MLELTAEEREVLIQVLQEAVSDLGEEIYKTENYDWRQDLKHREDLLKGILRRLSVQEVEG
jgi:hypothetical protein